MRRHLFGLALLATASVTTAHAADTYPAHETQGVIQWGAGGSTDTVMWSVTPHAEKILDQSVIMTNRTGGVGAIAMKFVQVQKSDGYTLLMGAENPMMYRFWVWAIRTIPT